jgi:hypothetical protein
VVAHDAGVVENSAHEYAFRMVWICLLARRDQISWLNDLTGLV